MSDLVGNPEGWFFRVTARVGVVFSAYKDVLLARTLNLQGIKFANEPVRE